jgi:hypothetical protein
MAYHEAEANASQQQTAAYGVREHRSAEVWTAPPPPTLRNAQNAQGAGLSATPVQSIPASTLTTLARIADCAHRARRIADTLGGAQEQKTTGGESAAAPCYVAMTLEYCHEALVSLEIQLTRSEKELGI